MAMSGLTPKSCALSTRTSPLRTRARLDSSGKTRRKFAVEESERIRSSTTAAYRSKALSVALGGAATAGELHSAAQNAVINVLDVMGPRKPPRRLYKPDL